MTFTAGTKLGTYEILGPLGKGGMGEVYRARDMRLGREIALKVLPPMFDSDSERVARFHREARCSSALVVTKVDRAGVQDPNQNKISCYPTYPLRK